MMTMAVPLYYKRFQLMLCKQQLFPACNPSQHEGQHQCCDLVALKACDLVAQKSCDLVALVLKNTLCISWLSLL